MIAHQQTAIKMPTPMPALTANFVPPMPDYQWGGELYMRGRDIEACQNAEQRRGWDDMEWRCFIAWHKGCMAEGQPAAELSEVIDGYPY